MRFTPKEDIKTKIAWGTVLEAGSAVTSEKRGIPDEAVEQWYAAGLVEIEGRDPAPPRKVTGNARLDPQPGRHGHAAQEG
jgi:hypothetical protein